MASDPIASWQIEEEKTEAGTDFIFLVSKRDIDRSLERHLLFGRKVIKT